MNRARYLGIGGEQAKVGIHAGGAGVVVAGADVRVTARDSIGIAPHEQRQFAMRLQANQSVEDLYARIFQIARPADVVGFIEAGFEFDHRSHFLARSSVDERRHDERVLVGAIKSLLDGQHPVVFRRRLYEVNYGIIGIEGVMQQNVVTA